MTSFELTKQPLAVFEHAGRIAFAMQIPKVNNPYPNGDKNGVPGPAHLAWDRGYQVAADEAYQREHPTRARVEYKRPRNENRRPDGRKVSRPANHPHWKGTAPEVRRAK
jgi:hypothetical protein